jgi:hypothetical protein
MTFDPIKSVKNFYKENIHKFDREGGYPLLDRLFAYVVPSASVVAYAKLGAHDAKYNPNTLTNKSWLPAGVAFYGLSQFVLTYVKPYADDMNKGFVKSAIKLGLKLFDNINDIILYIPAYNLLPETGQLNAVFGFKVLPAIVQGIESDISNWRKGINFEEEVAGRVYAEAVAGGVAANVSNALSEYVKSLDTINKPSKFEPDAKIAESISDAFLYAGVKKLLVGEKYESGEITRDVIKTIAQDNLKGSAIVKDLEGSLMTDSSVFAGFITAYAATSFIDSFEAFMQFLEETEITSAIESDIDALKINLTVDTGM